MKIFAITAALFASTLAAHADQVRITVRIFEMPQTTLTALLSDPTTTGKALHEKSLQLATTRKAKIVDTAVLTCLSGQRATLESVAELIYPTESHYDMPTITIAGQAIQDQFHPGALRPPTPTAFETRNTGSTLEFEATTSDTIDLRIQIEHISRNGYSTWLEFVDNWGDADIRFPIFDTMRVNLDISLLDGEVQLINVFTPKPAAIPDVEIRRLVFISATILRSPAP